MIFLPHIVCQCCLFLHCIPSVFGRKMLLVLPTSFPSLFALDPAPALCERTNCSAVNPFESFIPCFIEKRKKVFFSEDTNSFSFFSNVPPSHATSVFATCTCFSCCSTIHLPSLAFTTSSLPSSSGHSRIILGNSRLLFKQFTSLPLQAFTTTSTLQEKSSGERKSQTCSAPPFSGFA